MTLTNLWSWLNRGEPGRGTRTPGSRFARRFVPAVCRLEDRDVPNGYLAIGAGPGSPPLVAIRVDIRDSLAGSPLNDPGLPAPPLSDGQTDTTSQIFMAYSPTFRGGVNVATGNFDGDYTTPDLLVTAPKAGGGPHVIVWNTAQNPDGTIVVTTPRAQFMAFDPRFTGGVNITTGDLDGDGRPELICAAGPGGGPHVRIFTINAAGSFVLATEFFAYAADFRGGVSVASNTGYTTPIQVEQQTNLNSVFVTPYPPGETVPGEAQGIPLAGIDGVTGSIYFTIGGGVIQYLSGNLLNSYNQIAYRPNIPNGQLVAANWANTMPASNYPTDGSNPPTGVPVGPYVQIGTSGGTPVITRLIDAPGFRSGQNQLVTGAGPGGGPHVRVWDFTGIGTGLRLNSLAKDFFAFDASFRGGVNVSIGDVIASPVPIQGSAVVDPLDNGLVETTRNSGTTLTPTWPFSTNLYRRYNAEITVSMASGGSLVRVFADHNVAVTDPFSPFGEFAPQIRNSVAEVNLVPSQITVGASTLFNRGIDPQFTGGIVPTVSAFTFNGSANDQIVGANPVFGGAGFVVNPVLGQSVFATGTGAASPNRGSHIRVFNQMSRVSQLSPDYTPIDDFAGFSNYSGTGVSVSFGFGALPAPQLDLVRLPQTTITTVSNPILV